MYLKRIVNTFLALFSQKIAEFENKNGEFPVTIVVVDNLPSKEEKIKLENDLLNILVKQGWQVDNIEVALEKPAIIKITFKLYM